MASLDIIVGEAAAPSLFAHLAFGPEMVAFMRGTVRGHVVDLDDSRLLDNRDLLLDEWHVTLGDEARKRILTWAVGAEVIVEVHSHGSLGGAAVLSPTDLEGLASWVPHLMWRLPGIVYVSLVSAGDSFDGLAWRGDELPSGLGMVVFRGVGDWHTTGLSLKRWQRTVRE